MLFELYYYICGVLTPVVDQFFVCQLKDACLMVVHLLSYLHSSHKLVIVFIFGLAFLYVKWRVYLVRFCIYSCNQKMVVSLLIRAYHWF